MRVKVWARVCRNAEEEAAADREYWETLFTPEERVALINDLLRDWDRMNNRSLTPDRDFSGVFATLNQRKIRYLIVGTYAFAFHLKPRYMEHLDLLIEPCDEALEHPHVIFRQAIHGLTFEDAWATRVAAHYEGNPVHYLGRDALIRTKIAAGDLQALADVAALR